ncbi:MAG: AAA family ATPase [Bacteroidota bacterium]
MLLDKPAPHRVRVRHLALLPEDDWIPLAPLLDDLTVLREYPQFETPEQRFAAVARRIVHEVPAVDGKVLEFTIHARQAAPLGPILDFVERYVREKEEARDTDEVPVSSVRETPASYRLRPSKDFDRAVATEAVIAKIAAQGFVYPPWLVAAYLTALRTKPFALLTGPTGVGKSALPRLVAEATGGTATLLPVHPDWTDAAETLGYTDLAGRFRPGGLLRAARAAMEDPIRHHVAVLDEMNLARPEHYLADVLSRLEARYPTPRGYATAPLLGVIDVAAPWADVSLPPNLSLVGTVNVDESTYPFSRKVLDRAFVLPFGTEPLTAWTTRAGKPPAPEAWPVHAWQPRALRLAGLVDLSDDDQQRIQRVVGLLAEADGLLRPAGFAVGYRSRDEIALFVLHAGETPEAFRLADGTPVDPLDVALLAKLLPRLAGGSRALRDALAGLLAWSVGDTAADEAETLLDTYAEAGRPSRFPVARFPSTAARLARMLARLDGESYASFWDD